MSRWLNHRCIRHGALFTAISMLILVTYGDSFAQDPSLGVTAAQPPELTEAYMADLVVRYLGAPGVLLHYGVRLAQTFTGWSPTFRVELTHKHEPQDTSAVA